MSNNVRQETLEKGEGALCRAVDSFSCCQRFLILVLSSSLLQGNYWPARGTKKSIKEVLFSLLFTRLHFQRIRSVQWACSSVVVAVQSYRSNSALSVVVILQGFQTRSECYARCAGQFYLIHSLQSVAWSETGILKPPVYINIKYAVYATVGWLSKYWSLNIMSCRIPGKKKAAKNVGRNTEYLWHCRLQFVTIIEPNCAR